MRFLLSSLLASSFLIASCGAKEEASQTKFIDPITAGQIAGAVYGAISSHQSNQDLKRRISSLKGEIVRVGRELKEEMHTIDSNNKLAAASAFLDRFEYFDRWNANDLSENANLGQTLIRELETVVRNAPTQHAVATIRMFNLLVPAVASVQMVNGWGNVDATTISIAYDLNALFLNDIYYRYFAEHKLNRTIRPVDYPFSESRFNGFLLTSVSPYVELPKLEAVYLKPAAAMDVVYRSVLNVQTQIARRLGREVPKPAFFEGHHIAESGWVGYFNGSGAFCGFMSEQHLRLAGKTIQDAQSRGVVLPLDYLKVLDDHGACKVSIPVGFFKIKDRAEVFYSNGGDAYCYIPAPRFVTGPVTEYDFDIHNATRFANHGTCANM